MISQEKESKHSDGTIPLCPIVITEIATQDVKDTVQGVIIEKIKIDEEK